MTLEPAGSGEFGERATTRDGSAATAAVEAAFTAAGPCVPSVISKGHAFARVFGAPWAAVTASPVAATGRVESFDQYGVTDPVPVITVVKFARTATYPWVAIRNGWFVLATNVYGFESVANVLGLRTCAVGIVTQLVPSKVPWKVTAPPVRVVV